MNYSIFPNYWDWSPPPPQKKKTTPLPTMEVKIEIWDLPKTGKEASRFFQDKGLLPKTKQYIDGHSMTLYYFDKKPRWRSASWACQKQAGLHANT